MAAELTVTAIVAAHNEADIIGQVVKALVEDGVAVHLIDHGSTDGTAEEARRGAGDGRLTVERLAGSTFSLQALMRRKEELARTLDSDWFINHDADEFREGPWPGLGLRESIAVVDRLGYNAIDFEVLTFPPTHDGFRAGDDVRAAFTRFEPGRRFDRLQVRCWKRTPAVELVSSGGHEASFPGRRVFPLRFLLRHYPVRGQAHGVRKVFGERRGRFAEEERGMGWHRQYEGLAPDHVFLRDPATLVPYEEARVKDALSLVSRDAARPADEVAARDRESWARERETWGREADRRNRVLDDTKEALQAERRTVDARNRALDAVREDLEATRRELDARNREAARLHGDLHARNLEVAELRGRVAALEAALEAIQGSRTWRWSAPLRRLGGARG